jgi:hypothetical protein
MREQLDDLCLVAVHLLTKRFEAALQVVDLLIEVPDLQTHRRQVALDDPELAVVFLRDLFEAPGKSGELAVGYGVLGHAGRSCTIMKKAGIRISTISHLSDAELWNVDDDASGDQGSDRTAAASKDDRGGFSPSFLRAQGACR